jgi:hypothetical protein
MLGNYDRFTVGQKTITVSHLGFEATFNVTYTDANPDKNIEISSNSNVFFDQENTQPLCLTLQYNGINDSRKAIWYIDLATNADTHIWLLYGDDTEYKSIGELKTLGYVTRINAYGDTLIFNLDNDAYLKENVKRIKVLAGFYMCAAAADSWGVDGSANYTEMPNAILRHNTIVENNTRGRWVRLLSSADDALTVIFNPTKTTYKVGDTIDLTGMVVRLKYEDGGTEDVIPNANNVTKPLNGEFTEVGDAIEVTVNVNGQQVKFNVKVTAAGTDNDDDDNDDDDDNGLSGGEIAGIIVGSVAGAGIIGAGVFLFIKKKRKKSI